MTRASKGDTNSNTTNGGDGGHRNNPSGSGESSATQRRMRAAADDHDEDETRGSRSSARNDRSSSANGNEEEETYADQYRRRAESLLDYLRRRDGGVDAAGGDSGRGVGGEGKSAPGTNNDDTDATSVFRHFSNNPPPAAAAARRSSSDNNDGCSNYEEDTTTANNNKSTLTRLLSRLQREHHTNFGPNPADPRNAHVNVSRARYLLEASAGNVGLASAFYWEDYLVGNNNNNAEEGGGGSEASSSIASSTKAVSGEKKGSHGYKSEEDDNENGESDGPPARKKRRTSRKSAAAKKGGDDSDEEDGGNSSDSSNAKMGVSRELNNNNNNNRKGSDMSEVLHGAETSLNSMHQFQQAFGLKLSSLENRLKSLASSSAACSAGVASVASAAGGRNGGEDAASGNGSMDSTDAVDPRMGKNLKSALKSGKYSSPSNRSANDNNNNNNNNNSNNNEQAALEQAIAIRRALEEARRNLAANQNVARGGSNNGDGNSGAPAEEGLARIAAAYPDVWRQCMESGMNEEIMQYSETLYAALRNRSSVADESFASCMASFARFMRNPSERTRQHGRDIMEQALAQAIRSLDGRVAGASGCGADGGGNDDPEDGDDSGGDGSDEPRNNDVREADQPEEEQVPAAGLRRSGRIRAAAIRRDADNANNADAAPAEQQNNAGNNTNNRNGGASISDDDDATFRPGPEPVFREMKVEESQQSDKTKRKRFTAPRLFASSDSDDGSDDIVDFSWGNAWDENNFFNIMDDSIWPSRVLWASFPQSSSSDSDGSDDDDSPRLSIPPSWLRTGFVLSKCGNGLAVADPSDEEWERIRRSHPRVIRDGHLKGIKGLFPFHCKGLSALLSIVTAMLYSGASIRGGAVTCDSDRTPFDELSVEQRQKEFHSRLVDALSSLIFIAAKAKSQRISDALNTMDKLMVRRKKMKEDILSGEYRSFTEMRQRLKVRVGQCRVAFWETDSANNDATIFPAGRDPKDIQIHSSLTNIQDIRQYVQTHLRSFTEPGGCALFLETIVRCHGESHIEKLLGVDVSSSYAERKPVKLLTCRCKETLKYLEKRRSSMNESGPPPDEHDCIKVEFLSLLLTGQVFSSYQNWSADSIGIGLLRIDKGTPVGSRLLKPIKPIWICLGDIGYSTLFLESKDIIGKETSLDSPGNAFRLAHWNCWSGERTGMKVLTSMYNEGSVLTDLNAAVISDFEEDGKRTVTQSIVEKQHDEIQRDAVDQVDPATADPDLLPITDEELQSTRFHPEDEKYYAGQYRRWRYQLGGGNGDEWVPFYRLKRRQKLIVEMKLAPRICVLVRSRWPLATLRDFSPAGKFPVV
eukprot:scaffold4188_cov272-Alexandrium_tamarense.AAC.1